MRFARWLRLSHWGIGLLAIIAVLLLRRLLVWREGEIWVVLGLLALWLFGGLLFSLLRRPGDLDSLLLLDRLGGWKDRFSSAWSFLKDGKRDEAMTLHILRAEKTIDGAASQFPETLPLPSLKWVWVFPLLAILLSVTSPGRIPTAVEDLVLTGEMQDAAALQAEELAREAERVKNLESLREDEKEELERLRVEVTEMSDRLAEADGLTAGEMLDALEARARAAEKLADKLGMGDDEWASAEMLAEMARHPDTGDLALSIRDRDAEPAALEAMELQGILDNPEITRETGERVAGALESIMNEATDEDKARPVGERFGNASRKMLDSQPRPAAREFEELAKHFRFLGSREEAKEKLEQLANSLRDAGSEISGSELQQMEKIAEENREDRAAPAGLKGLDADGVPEDLQKLLAPQMAQSGAQQPQPGTQGQEGSGDPKAQNVAPVPGMTQAENRNQNGQKGGEANAMKAPVPGENPPEGDQGQGMGLSDKAKDGQGEGGMLSAPVPGMDPGQSSEGAGMAASGGTSNQAGRGGNEAGSGTAEMFDNETEALKATKDSDVVAQINENGDSSVRAVEGQARQEKAARTRQEIMADFISAEEQALDGKSLPMSRREHVIRYFSAIRRQFEEEESAK